LLLSHKLKPLRYADAQLAAFALGFEVAQKTATTSINTPASLEYGVEYVAFDCPHPAFIDERFCGTHSRWEGKQTVLAIARGIVPGIPAMYECRFAFNVGRNGDKDSLLYSAATVTPVEGIFNVFKITCDVPEILEPVTFYSISHVLLVNLPNHAVAP
jgi:hypothetical protein